MVGTDCYVQGNLVEFGIDGAGGFEGIQTSASPVPNSMHPRSGNLIFGFVANPQNNAWATFDGDFFTPGSPENGWGIELIDGITDLNASNNCSGSFDMLGSITAYQSIGSCKIITWEGNYINSPYNLHIKIDYVLGINDLFYTTVLTITNNGINIPDFYYYRNFDPDNNQSISGDFTTQNTVVSQPGIGCNKAHVKATSELPLSQPISYVGMAGVGANFRATYGGFFNRDASDIWNNIGLFVGNTGATNFDDEAVSLAYRIQNFAPSSTQSFRYVIILDDLAANNAVNNLFSISWPGSPSSTATFCNPVVDTVTICSGASIPITINGSALSSFNWVWTPATGLSTTTGATVTASPTINTLYTATGTPVDPCFNPVTQQVFVKISSGAINVNAGVNQALTCVTSNVMLAGSSTTSGATFSWSGPGIVSGATTATPTVNVVGNYILTVSSPAGCSSSDTTVVSINNTTPNGDAGLDQILTCTNTSVNLIGSTSTTAATFNWSGPSITAGATSLTPTINAIGTYTITVTDTINGCTVTDMAIVTINNTPPNIDAGLDQMLNCVVTSLSLNASSTTIGATYNWSGPSITSGFTTLTPTINSAGTYTITVTNSANGCTLTDMTVVTINNTLPNANAGVDMTLTCASPTLNLAGFSSTIGSTFNWSGPGIIAGGTTTTPTVNTVGNYTITVTDINNGCEATDITLVDLNGNLPNVNAGIDQLLNCSITSLDLIGSSSSFAVTYSWGGPGIIAGGNTSTATINVPGNYTLTVTDSTNSCANIDVIEVLQNIISPGANAGMDNELTCVITSLNLNGNSTTTNNISCMWAGTGIISGGSTWSPTINLNGTYSLTVTDLLNGCTSLDMVDVILNTTPPNLVMGANQNIICNSPLASISGTSTTLGVNFFWSGISIVGSVNTPSTFADTAGIYNVIVTDVLNGCTTTGNIEVTIDINIPTANFIADNLFSCEPLNTTLIDISSVNNSTIIQWDWTIESFGILNGANTGALYFSTPGSYDVSLIVTTIEGCKDTITINDYLTVYPNPVANFSYTPEKITLFSPLINFMNTSFNATSYLWDFGNGNTTTINSPNHTYIDTGVYCVKLLAVNDFGCYDTALHCLYIEPIFSIYIPNSFTANNDGLNDIFTIVGMGVNTIDARIYNRWGEEIYFFNDINKGWTGTRRNGENCLQGTYLYKIIITDYNGGLYNYLGNVNLIR